MKWLGAALCSGSNVRAPRCSAPTPLGTQSCLRSTRRSRATPGQFRARVSVREAREGVELQGRDTVTLRVEIRVRARVGVRLGSYRGERVASRGCKRSLRDFKVVLHLVDELAGYRGHVEDVAESRDGLWYRSKEGSKTAKRESVMRRTIACSLTS